MLAAGVASCRNHAEREALGVCVRCRARVCAECVTKVDGINYCVGCLAELAKAEGRAGGAETRDRSLAGPAAWALALLGGAFLVLATWGLVEVALPG